MTRLPVPEMIRWVQADVHPPLYYLILKAWTGIFGTSEAGLRIHYPLTVPGVRRNIAGA